MSKILGVPTVAGRKKCSFFHPISDINTLCFSFILFFLPKALPILHLEKGPHTSPCPVKRVRLGSPLVCPWCHSLASIVLEVLSNFSRRALGWTHPMVVVGCGCVTGLWESGTGDGPPSTCGCLATGTLKILGRLRIISGCRESSGITEGSPLGTHFKTQGLRA